MSDLSDHVLDAAILLGVMPDQDMLRSSLVELRDRRKAEATYRASAFAVAVRLPVRCEATGSRQTTVSPAGKLVTYRDYIAAVDALMPYRVELLTLAAQFGDAADPFALWERIKVTSP